ncbi:Chemotaxis signal transduction protein [Pseudomonas sp. 8BK]|uniref:chemotaxis protein CheW n=1 Tax=Pseudomonas sp. 8BK TaxID=2653164 RepID=UPI0012F3FDD3|nr:chemotaxis protein CheW [Pseudomonas sp. 8BK]VXC36547.1 Chemotaxis signal transduction protein [Pseudomonas sp. 8BK]
MHTPSAGQTYAKREAGELYLLFSLDQDRYALSVHEVVEVLPLRRLKAFPQAPSWVAGGFEYRGALVPVIDLLVRACARPAATLTSTRLVLVQYQPANRVLGLILEKATDTLRLSSSAFADSALHAGEAQYLGGVQRSAQGLVQRIEVAGLLPADVRALLFPEPGGTP